MRLSKAVKADIIEAWGNAKWRAKLKGYGTELEAELKAAFEKVAADNIKVVETNNELRKYFNTKNYFGLPYEIKDSIRNTFAYVLTPPNMPCAEYASECTYSAYMLGVETASPAVKAYNKKVEVYFKEKQTLENVLASVTTVKKLIDLLPEIEKYTPTKGTVTTLVAAGDLTKAKAIL